MPDASPGRPNRTVIETASLPSLMRADYCSDEELREARKRYSAEYSRRYLALPGKREELRARHHTPEQVKSRRLNMTEEQRERERCNNRLWAHANPALESARQRRWRAKNKRARAVARRLWKQNNPEKVRAWRIAAHLRRMAIAPPDAEAFARIKVIVFEPCTYCGAAMEHVDHLIPVSARRLGEGATPGDNSADNLWPACGICNMRKLDYPLEWFLEREHTRRTQVDGQNVADAWLAGVNDKFVDQLTWPGCRKPRIELLR